VLFFIGIFVSPLLSCEKSGNEDLDNKLAEFNMKIIPESPTSKDVISLVVFNDCEYNTLSGVRKTAKTIEIEKQFNSQMKWPCVQRNDTIEIGKLPKGTYSVNYKLIDISPQTTKPVQLDISFDLEVAK
jgi:hypothetical protein